MSEINFSINTIVYSALGAGYGSLTYKDFVSALNNILKQYNEEKFTVYVANKKF